MIRTTRSHISNHTVRTSYLITIDHAIVGLYAFSFGITILIGAFISKIERFPDNERKEGILCSIVAFGGGVLFAAVAFVLTPRGIELLSIPSLSAAFISGALVFFVIDKKLGQSGTTFSQLMAMLMDFFPEAIALDAVFGHDRDLGLLFAIFIGLQNLPEGFNSYKELINNGFSANKSLLILLPPFNTAIVNGFNRLFSEKRKLGSWHEYLTISSSGSVIHSPSKHCPST